MSELTTDVNGAARILHKKPDTVRRMAKQRLIPAMPPSGRTGWVFIIEDLLSYIRSQYPNAAEAAVKEGVCSLSGGKVVEIGTPRSRSTAYHEVLGLTTDD